MKKIDNRIINIVLNMKTNNFFWWPFFILYYILLKFALGLSYPMIYGFIFALLILRVSFEKITIIFLSISLVTYITGAELEANHYMSYVYVFLVLSVIKHIYFVIKKRLNKAMPIKSEKTRRRLNVYSDNKPSHKHYFNYKTAKRFVYKKKVLDVGCWSGQFEELIIDDVEAIVGIDPSKVAIKYAKERITEGSFYVGSVEKLPFDNKSFDTVTLFDVLEHVPVGTEMKGLREIYRVLDDKGYLIISTPNKHILSILLDPAFFLIGHRHYSQKELTNMLKKTGFHIEKVFKIGGFFDLSSHVFEMILKHIFKTSFKYPKILKKKIKGEYKKRGVASLYIIAKKN